MTSFADAEMLAVSGADNAWYNSSFVVTTFSISLDALASCNVIDWSKRNGLAWVNDQPLNSANALFAEIAFYKITFVSTSSTGGSVGKSLYGWL